MVGIENFSSVFSHPGGCRDRAREEDSLKQRYHLGKLEWV
jgi:hypothetical protein